MHLSRKKDNQVSQSIFMCGRDNHATSIILDDLYILLHISFVEIPDYLQEKKKHLKMTTISLIYEICAVVMSFPNITLSTKTKLDGG